MALTRRDVLASSLAFALAPAADSSRVRLGCQTRAYGSPISDREKLLAVLDDLAALGYEGFETNFQSLAHSFADPEPTRREIEKRRIKLIGLHLGVGFFDLARIEQEQAQVAEVARAVKALGGTHLMLSGNQPRDGWSAERIEHKCEALNRAGRSCIGLGVRLCAHNHTHELQHGAAHLKAVFTKTDPKVVSFVLDVGNVFPPEFTALDAVRQFGSRIAAFHLRDLAQGREVVMGTGDFDFAALGRVLHEIGWPGWLIVEVNRRGDIPSRRLVEMARDHVRKTMKL